MTRAILLVSWLTACGSGVAVGRVTTRHPTLAIKSNVGDAELFVDGRFVAPLDALAGGISVVPGTHRIELRHEDYFSSYLEIQMAPAERKYLTINMAPILP